MNRPVPLSSHRVSGSIIRDCPRPEHLRAAGFAQEYDWDTVFYDVYRSGRNVVFQGPPLLNFLPELKRTAPFKGQFGFPRFAAQHIGHNKRGEIWLRSGENRFQLDCALGKFDISVQPDMAPLFAGRRVIQTLSKNNDLAWIMDWVRFYRAEHGANGALIYDNGSTLYSAGELDARLREAFPDMALAVVSWPFRFGPQGGLAGAVDGVETPWDSDFCQIGSLQHARFRFLQQARSALNVDIDELVLGSGGRSIFEATEQTPARFIKFTGVWITAAGQPGFDPAACRHADFTLRDPADPTICPPKWCTVPAAQKRSASWSVHNLFGCKANAQVAAEFTYRHMRGISTSWKEARQAAHVDNAALIHDEALIRCFARADLGQSMAAIAKAGAIRQNL